MVVRIHNLDKWRMIETGEVLELAPGPLRKMRFEVNCEHPTRFDVKTPDALTFIAVVQGYEVLEFTAGEGAALVPSSEGEVWYFTNDGDQIATGASAEAVPFTRIMQRKARNRELEFMMMKAEQRMNRRMTEQAGEIAELRAQMIERGIDPDTGEVIEDGERDGAGAGASGEAAGGESKPPAVESEKAGATDGK